MTYQLIGSFVMVAQTNRERRRVPADARLTNQDQLSSLASIIDWWGLEKWIP